MFQTPIFTIGMIGGFPMFRVMQIRCLGCKKLTKWWRWWWLLDPKDTGMYTLGVAPSQDASGKLRFSLGFPIKHVIILVVTGILGGGHIQGTPLKIDMLNLKITPFFQRKIIWTKPPLCSMWKGEFLTSPHPTLGTEGWWDGICHDSQMFRLPPSFASQNQPRPHVCNSSEPAKGQKTTCYNLPSLKLT